MPILTSLRKLVCCASPQEDEAEARARPPRPEPAQVGPAQAGRPYRDYVENEAVRYWRDIGRERDLVKPARRELRAAVIPILCGAQRYRPGPKLNPELDRAHMAANALHLHAAESGGVKPPYSRPALLPNYVEALVRLADDAGWLAREIPLPDHPPPLHPVIYYTVDPSSGEPVPREDALIRGDYVYTSGGKRLTEADYIHPWPATGNWPSLSDLNTRGWDACYSLDKAGDTVEILLYWAILYTSGIVMTFPLEELHFSPHPPEPGFLAWLRDARKR